LSAGEAAVSVALDQNFPEPILDSLAQFLPDVILVPLRRIHPALTDMPDRRLLLALDRMGWPVLVTNNYKMMQNPLQIAGLLKTHLTLFVIEGLGHDPIRATGAVLLDLPGALRRRRHDQAEVFWSRPRNPSPQDPWELFQRAAERAHREPGDLYEEMKVTDTEVDQASPE
jgi:hypothetical protein